MGDRAASRAEVRRARRSRGARLRSKPGGFLVECVLDTGQRLHSDPFGEFDREDAVKLAEDLRRRSMVEFVYVLRIGTGEVVFEKYGWHRGCGDCGLVTVSAPRDRILLPPPWVKHPFGCGCNDCEHFRGEHGS